jgi:hypothetical protein
VEPPFLLLSPSTVSSWIDVNTTGAAAVPSHRKVPCTVTRMFPVVLKTTPSRRRSVAPWAMIRPASVTNRPSALSEFAAAISRSDVIV